MLTLVVSLVLAGGPPGWHDGDVAAALKAATADRHVLVNVHAVWCEPCNQLEAEVLNGPDGLALLAGAAAGVRVDFDTPAGQDAAAKYGIVGLPTTLVLTARGEEVGRVEGYDGRAEFLAAMRDAEAGKVGYDAVAKQAAAKPDDLDLAVTFAMLRLSRGDAGAEAVLSQAMKAGGDVGVRATRLWGRWLLRVKREAPRAADHFLAAMKAAEGTKPYAGYLYWAAKALSAQGKAAEALALFDARIAREPRSQAAHEDKADFMVLEKLDVAVAEKEARAAIALNEKADWAHYLLAQTRGRQGDAAGAKAAVKRALELQPDKAIYVALLRRLK